MTVIRRYNGGLGSHSLSYLNEVNRRELVLKTTRQSPERVQRSKGYKITGQMEIDVSKFIEDDLLVISIPVNQYTCTIELRKALQTIIYVVDRQHRGNVNFDSVEKALNKAIDQEKFLKVNCTCPDFYYRYSYVATKNGYKNGKRQLIPAPIRNPHDNIGSFCKHLTMILKNKTWVRKLTNVINYLIKEYYDEIIKYYDLDKTHFFINKSGQHNPKYIGIRPQDMRSKIHKDLPYIDRTTKNRNNDVDMDEEERNELYSQ